MARKRLEEHQILKKFEQANAHLSASLAEAHSATTHAVDSGRILNDIKEHTPHGGWLSLLAKHWKYSQQWANSVMRAARIYDSGDFKLQARCNFSVRGLLALESQDATPDVSSDKPGDAEPPGLASNGKDETGSGITGETAGSTPCGSETSDARQAPPPHNGGSGGADITPPGSEISPSSANSEPPPPPQAKVVERSSAKMADDIIRNHISPTFRMVAMLAKKNGCPCGLCQGVASTEQVPAGLHKAADEATEQLLLTVKQMREGKA